MRNTGVLSVALSKHLMRRGLSGQSPGVVTPSGATARPRMAPAVRSTRLEWRRLDFVFPFARSTKCAALRCGVWRRAEFGTGAVHDVEGSRLRDRAVGTGAWSLRSRTLLALESVFPATPPRMPM